MRPTYIILLLLAITHEIKGAIESPCPKIFVFEPDKSVDDRWYGLITLSTKRDIKGVTLELEFDKSIIQLGNWLGAVSSDDDNIKFTIKNDKHQINAGQTYKAEIYVVYDPYYDLEPPRLLKIKFNGREICPHYEEEQISTTVVVASNDFSRPTILLNINVPKCGVTIATQIELILHGGYTKPGEYPWHAALYRKEGQQRNYICGGSLISEQHVLTAAHCTTFLGKTQEPKDFVIILGKHAFWADSNNEQTFSATKIIVHDSFNHSNFFNDISIIKLDRNTQYTKFVRPICLWEEGTSLSTVVNQTGTAVGFGKDHNNNANTDLLMQAPMPVIDTLKCVYSYPEFYSLFTNPNNFCAGYANGTSVCTGDSGGGLAFPRGSGRNTVWYLRGIVSNTVAKQGTCDPNYYVLFTDVAQYLDWISKNIKT